jgi:deazaflavin-dependent oxidoreductase (nitroreductase family)
VKPGIVRWLDAFALNDPEALPERARDGTMSTPKQFNQRIIEEFRARGGKVGGPFEGARLLLLHSTGAKSGQARVNPLAYRRDGDRLVVFATKAGAPTNPDWYHNLRSNPRAGVEVGTETYDVTARVAEKEERDRLWRLQTEEIPGFADYEQKTEREIPVVILERAA